DLLLIVERVEQALVVVFQQVFPDRSFDLVTIGHFPIGRRTDVTDALVSDTEQALLLALIDVLVLVDASFDRGNFLRRRLAALRVSRLGKRVHGQRQNAGQNSPANLARQYCPATTAHIALLRI